MKRITAEERELLADMYFHRGGNVPWERVDELATILPDMLEHAHEVRLTYHESDKDGGYISVEIGTAAWKKEHP